jgi:glycosyltransferase involved in cell wall biosynthesis
MSPTDSLRKLDGRPVPERPGEIRACLVVRNEALRLPSVLDHARKLGVERFLIVDNGSDDGTLEFLLAQDDVHVFSTTERYADAESGIVWTNQILDRFCDGHWTLTIDADELFVYPRYEQVPLRKLCDFLDGADKRGVFALMLDMYSDRSLAETVHGPGGALTDTCAYFDRGPYHAASTELFPYTRLYGGVRERLFGGVLQGRYDLPVISKVPLVNWRAGTAYLASTHFVTPLPLSDLAGALLHFKFLHDFHERAVTEAARAEHYNQAYEYKAYVELLALDGAFKLMSPASVRFEGGAQLVGLGLMQTSDAYERFANALG